MGTGNYVGGLAGSGSTIIASYSSGTITGAGSVGGLAGSIGTIRNSNSEAEVTGTGTSTSVGGLAGSNSSAISNSYFTGKVTGTGSGTSTFVGGLTGSNSGTISDSYYAGTMTGLGTGANTYIGGIAGRNSGAVSGSYSTNTVTGSATINSGASNVYVGGLVGDNTNTSTSAISNSYSVARVSGTGTNNGSSSNISVYTGGLVGNNANTNISAIRNNYSVGEVTGTRSGTYSSRVNIYVGGLVGNNSGAAVSSSYYNIETSGQNDEGNGDGKSTMVMKEKATYYLWDFDEFWRIDPTKNNGYPYLQQIASTAWYNASQSEFTIKTAEELTGFARLVNNGSNFERKTIKLGANIMLNDTTNWRNWGTASPARIWKSMGNGSDRFRGTFDGNDFVVSGVYINNSDSYQGLFGSVDSSGTIKNLGIIASYIKGGAYVGGLTGWNYGTISNSYSTSSVKGTTVGGLTSCNYGTISSSYFTGIVESTSISGGLVGLNYGTVSNSYSTGIVESTSVGAGLTGYNYGTISNSYSNGTVEGTNSGGLVYFNSGAISNSYSTSIVMGEYTGGLVFVNSGTITYSYYDTQINRQYDVDNDAGKTTAEMKQQSTFIGWNFNSIWGINSTINCGYPYLRGFDYSGEQICNEDPSSSGKISKIANINGVQLIKNGVSLQVTNNASLELFNLKGKSIRKIDFTNGTYSIEFSNLPKGLYFVKVQFENSSREIVKVPIK